MSHRKTKWTKTMSSSYEALGGRVEVDVLVRFYDNGGRTCDRYMALVVDKEKWGYGRFDKYPCLHMSANQGPQGVCMSGDWPHVPTSWDPNRYWTCIKFEDLPEACQKAVRMWLQS